MANIAEVQPEPSQPLSSDKAHLSSIPKQAHPVDPLSHGKPVDTTHVAATQRLTTSQLSEHVSPISPPKRSLQSEKRGLEPLSFGGKSLKTQELKDCGFCGELGRIQCLDCDDIYCEVCDRTSTWTRKVQESSAARYKPGMYSLLYDRSNI